MLLQTGFRRGAPDSQLANPQRGKMASAYPCKPRKRTTTATNTNAAEIRRVICFGGVMCIVLILPELKGSRYFSLRCYVATGLKLANALGGNHGRLDI
jgi:hypothetical protein